MGLIRGLSAGAAAAIAGAVAAIIPPVVVLGAGLPIWIGLGSAAVAGWLLWLLLKPRYGREEREADAGQDMREATARALLEEGEAALRRLRASLRQMTDKPMQEEFRLLVMRGEQVIREARNDPACVMQVRRLLNFYLPNAASVAEGWCNLEQRPEAAPRLADQSRETVARLNEAFEKFAEEMHEPKVQTLDLDLKVLDNALKADLERAP